MIAAIPYLKNLGARNSHFAPGYEALQKLKSNEYTATIDAGEYDAWKSNPKTNHAFFSPCVGTNADKRVSEANPPEYAIAFVGDFDDLFVEEIIKAKIERAEFPPTYISKTKRGNLRAIWHFSKPVQFAGDAALAKKFFEVLGHEIHAPNFYTGLDQCSFNPAQYFDVADGWQQVGESLDSDIVTLAHFTAAKHHPKYNVESDIPFDAVKEEVEKRFADSLRVEKDADFAVDTRCNRFWEDGTNPTICWIKPAGIYNHERSKFVTWKEILGSRFVDKYRAQTIESIVADWYLEGNRLWETTPSGVAVRGMDLFKYHLLEFGVEKKNDAKDFVNHIRTTKTVDGVGPVIYGQKPVATVGRKRILNTSSVELTKPVQGDFSAWEGLIGHIFQGDEISMSHFLRWTQRAYESAHSIANGGDGKKGLALFICGAKETGKSTLVNALSDFIFGGAADPEAYFTGETAFNEEIYEKFIWRMDDPPSITGDPRQRRTVTTKIKFYVASDEFTVTAKGRKTINTRWKGRIVVSCNDDADSIQALPDNKGAVDDKVLILGTTDKKLNVKDGFRSRLEEQAPAFLFWVLNLWRPSEYWTETFMPSESLRFGQLAYTTPRLAEEIDANDTDGDLLTILREYADEVGNGEIEMSAGNMLEDITGLKSFCRNGQQLGVALKRLKVKHPEVVSVPERSNNRGRKWIVRGFDVAAGVEEPF
jgi:hypothetical protein